MDNFFFAAIFIGMAFFINYLNRLEKIIMALKDDLAATQVEVTNLTKEVGELEANNVIIRNKTVELEGRIAELEAQERVTPEDIAALRQINADIRAAATRVDKQQVEAGTVDTVE